MTSPTPTDTQTMLARRMRVDIDLATYPAIDWQQLIAIEELKHADELRTEGDEAYEDDGYDRKMVTGSSYRIELKIKNRKDAAGVSLATVHAFLKGKFEASKGSTLAGEFSCRIYDRDGLEQARQARALITKWDPEGGDSAKPDVVSLTIQFQGKSALVANPLATAVPAVTGLVPPGGSIAGGTPVLIKGSKFTGVTGAAGVKFGANNATSYTFVDDTRIVAVAPAGTAGAKDVTVTTPGGTSPTAGTGNDFTYA